MYKISALESHNCIGVQITSCFLIYCQILILLCLQLGLTDYCLYLVFLISQNGVAPDLYFLLVLAGYFMCAADCHHHSILTCYSYLSSWYTCILSFLLNLLPSPLHCSFPNLKLTLTFLFDIVAFQLSLGLNLPLTQVIVPALIL